MSKKSRKFDFLFHLHLGVTLHSETDALSKTLQSAKFSLVEGKRLGNFVIESLQKDRDKERFKLFQELILFKRAQNGKIEKLVVPRAARKSHGKLNLNNNFQLDSAQRVRYAQVTQNACDYCKRLYFE